MWSRFVFRMKSLARIGSSITAFAVTFIVLGAAAPHGFAPAAAAATSPTTVSLTFDDGDADQMLGLPALQSHNMVATYYLNSAKINGDSNYMTWQNVSDLAAAGNEIAGHTLYHPDLPKI